MKFRVQAFDQSGKAVVETVEAADANEAADILRRRALFVSSSEPLASGSLHTDASKPTRTVGAGRRLPAVSAMARQLSVLISTGTPLVEAIKSLERQAGDAGWQAVLRDVRERLEEGKQLSEAMAIHPEWFDPICRSLVCAGENSGKLDVLLDRLAQLVRQQQKVRSSLIGAMVYPCLLITVAVGVLGLMVGFVMPRFEGLFKSLGAGLPPTTKVLMSVGAGAREYWWAILAAAIVTVLLARLWLATDAGRRAIDVALVSLPQIGRVTRAFATARLARVLGVLLEGRVALLDALSLVRQSSGNSLYADLIRRAEDAVTRGENLSTVLARPATGPALILPSVYEAVRSAEKTGQVGPVLINLAQSLDEDNEVLVRSLTSIMEPLILVVLGAIVGLVAISMFLPLFDLAAAGHGGGA